MAHVKIHKQVPENANSGEWTLCFQKVTYRYDDEVHKMGFASFGGVPMEVFKLPEGRLA